MVTCLKEVEYYLQLQNRQHFGQAETEGTLLTATTMKEKFNWEANTYKAELALAGLYNDKDIDEVSRLLLKNLRQALPEEEDRKYITREQFIGKIKAWRESMSTSPSSGRHLGHYKVLLTAPPLILLEDKKDKWIAKQEYIIACHVMMINYCTCYGYVLERWKEVANMMIYKEKGNVKIH